MSGSSKSAFNRSGDGVTPPRSGVTGITRDNMATESPSTSKLKLSDTTKVPDNDSMDIDPPNKLYTKKSISKAGKISAKNNQGIKKAKINNVKGEILNNYPPKNIYNKQNKTNKTNTPYPRYQTNLC